MLESKLVGRVPATLDYYSGCGNLFLIGYDPNNICASLSAQDLATLCSSIHQPVDGLLFLQGNEHSLRMNYFNNDGSRAKMCGNGLRCLAHFAHSLFPTLPSIFHIQTDVGDRMIHVLNNDLISVDMGPMTSVSKPLPSKEKDFYMCTIGVPHALFIGSHLPSGPIEEKARPFRFHPVLGNEGANISYATYSVLPSGTQAHIRTYERGVENETGACGTGACALACILASQFNCPFPFFVQFVSGETAEISLTNDRLFLTASVKQIGRFTCKSP